MTPPRNGLSLTGPPNRKILVPIKANQGHDHAPWARERQGTQGSSTLSLASGTESGGLGAEVGEGKDSWMKSQESAPAHVQGDMRQVSQPQLACLYNGYAPTAHGIAGLRQSTASTRR